MRFLVLLAALCVTTVPAFAQRAELISQTELRVCADPSNLPFSNRAGEGFENRIATLIGADMELPVTYVWFPQTIGFVRNTLRARECDLVMGTVSGDGIHLVDATAQAADGTLLTATVAVPIAATPPICRST